MALGTGVGGIGRVLRMTAAGAALMTAACAGTDPFARTPDLAAPARIAAAPDAAQPPIADWVAALGDPALGPLIGEALEANPDVNAALAAFQAARASARAAGAPRLPFVDAEGGVSSRETEFTGETTTYSLGLTVAWEADLWGRLSDQARSGALSAEAALADLYGARLSIAGATAQAWFFLIEARLQSELAERDVATRTDQLEVVERRFANGLVRSSDVRTARSARATAAAALASRRQAEAAAARSLEVLLGRYPEGAIAAGEDLPAFGALPAPPSPALILEARPDTVAAESRVAAAGFSAEAARKALYPRLNLTAIADLQSEDADDLLRVDSLITSVAGSLVAPLFRGGSLRAERDRTEALAEQQAALYVRTALAALQEVEDAYFADGQLADRVAASRIAFEEAEAALELVERQYASGVATIFDLIDAQTRATSAESNLILAQRERATNRVALFLAIASDFETGGGIRGVDIEGAPEPGG